MLPLNGSQSRQLIDCEQAYAAYRAAERDYRQRFAGSMAWKTVSGKQYLYRKKEDRWASLGPRSPETEQAYERFLAGREALKARRRSLDETIRQMAPVNRAMRLGRVPWTSARILRRLDRAGMLGHGLRVAGTHALYAYERMAGVHLPSGDVSTQDIDLLFDSRSGLSFADSAASEAGLLGLLRAVDPTFEPTGKGSFRAANDKVFMVDLITPLPRNASRSPSLAAGGDLTPVEIAGLSWLESSPPVEQVVIDERGFPLTMAAPDPRAFALHKAWLARRDDRDPLKKRRDAGQARIVSDMLAAHLPHLRFDDPALTALPAALRALAPELVAASRAAVARPDWDEA
jgi:hypothetical protein